MYTYDMRRRPMKSASLSFFLEFGNLTNTRIVNLRYKMRQKEMNATHCSIKVKRRRLTPTSSPRVSNKNPRAKSTFIELILSAGCLATWWAISCPSTVANPSSLALTGKIPVKTKIFPPGRTKAFLVFLSSMTYTC